MIDKICKELDIDLDELFLKTLLKENQELKEKIEYLKSKIENKD